MCVCVRVDRPCVEYHFQHLFTYIFETYYFPDVVSSKERESERRNQEFDEKCPLIDAGLFSSSSFNIL